MYKNYLNKRKHGRLDSTDCLDSLSLFNQNLTLSSGQQREVKGFLPIGPSRQSSHKCLKSNVLQKNKSSSSTSPPTPPGSTCQKSTLLLMVLKESQGDLHPGNIITEVWKAEQMVKQVKEQTILTIVEPCLQTSSCLNALIHIPSLWRSPKCPFVSTPQPHIPPGKHQMQSVANIISINAFSSTRFLWRLIQ